MTAALSCWSIIHCAHCKCAISQFGKQLGFTTEPREGHFQCPSCHLDRRTVWEDTQVSHSTCPLGAVRSWTLKFQPTVAVTSPVGRKRIVSNQKWNKRRSVAVMWQGVSMFKAPFSHFARLGNILPSRIIYHLRLWSQFSRFFFFFPSNKMVDF